MESFVLSETLKVGGLSSSLTNWKLTPQYLYLLFNDDEPSRLTNQVYTTEGHPLSLSTRSLKPPSPSRRQLHKGENLQCPRYHPPTVGGGLVVGIERRADYEYARRIVYGPSVAGVLAEDKQRVQWWEGGHCSIPEVPKYVRVPRVDINTDI